MELRNNVLRMRSKFFSNFGGQDIKAMPIAKRTGKKARKTIRNMLPPSNFLTQLVQGSPLSCFSRASQIFSQVPSPLSSLKYVMVVPSIVVVSLNQGTILHRRPGEAATLHKLPPRRTERTEGQPWLRSAQLAPTSSESGQQVLAGAQVLPRAPGTDTSGYDSMRCG